jgi:hypothetical protein
VELIDLGSSTLLVVGSYSREQSSTLYMVVTAGEAVEVGCNAVGRVVRVGAADKAVRVG